MWEIFQEKERALFKLCNGKKVCLWGYGYSGRFCEHLFNRANKEIEYIIDDSAFIDNKVDIERSFIIREFDRNTHIILLAFPREDKVISFLEELGYEENKNYVFVVEWFYNGMKDYRKLSYYDWLEYTYGLDIVRFKSQDEMESPSEESLYYSPGIDYSVIEVLDKFEFDENDAAFDLGCGKGEILLLFNAVGMKKVGGVEYDKELYNIALSNMQKMNISPSGIINADATKIRNELDDYNYFFMYNPFQGETFEKVIVNLEESYRRQKRKIFLIYSGPYCHDLVIKNGVFKFSKTIKTDYSVKNVRIYCTNFGV